MISGLGLKKISTEAVDGYTRIASRNRTAWCDLHASREIGMQVERRSCAACVSQGFRIRLLVREASLQMAHASITGSAWPHAVVPVVRLSSTSTTAHQHLLAAAQGPRLVLCTVANFSIEARGCFARWYVGMTQQCSCELSTLLSTCIS